MKKPVFITLILFTVYCLGVVLYYQKDEITKQVTAVTTSLTSSTAETEFKNEMKETTPVSPEITQKVIPGKKNKDGSVVAPYVELSVTDKQNFDLKNLNNVAAPERSVRSSQLSALLANSSMRNIITIMLALFAMLQWIDYMSKFSPTDAFPKIITPAIATFFALKWDMILTWFRI